jgi:hypothetical protein
MQKSNGGWPQLSRYEADAYSTGEALFALRQAGVPISDTAFTKGIKFLVSTQANDGTWRVRTRMISPAEISPKYFHTGFPYGKDEFLSYAGSCWAVMALLSAMPETTAKVASIESTSPEGPGWLKTALFGTAKQFAALLDNGLDPNSTTKNGTTVLMAAATDPEKIRVLLAHGAAGEGTSRLGCRCLDHRRSVSWNRCIAACTSGCRS